MKDEEFQECRNCKAPVKKGTRRCEYCGILNPTVTIKEVLKTIFIVIVVMYIFTYFTK
ncbi:MAG: hypothetical protein U9O56_07585 [Campylobacterota bacterium]|nr:hypothetical protein [Campylobacterota bacterium]